MKKSLKRYCLAILLLSYTSFLHAQKRETFIDTIQIKGQIWDKAFNMRDTTVYFSVVDTAVSITAGSGTFTGLSRFKFITNRLHSNRPDIVMNFKIDKAEVNNNNDIGYDTGEWTELWTEKGDISKSELKGKYWRMWKRQSNQWKIMTVVLTPLSCKGSYCNK